jgi:hypothetical protein
MLLNLRVNEHVQSHMIPWIDLCHFDGFAVSLLYMHVRVFNILNYSDSELPIYLNISIKVSRIYSLSWV